VDAPNTYNDLTKSENRLGGEVNIESIRTLDEQIRDHEATLIRLKRTRNSLLNVSKFPPEVLGNIFRWNVTIQDDFGRLEKESHNFLLVCHYWFEVASRTPELWGFWGNSLEDWERRHLRYPAIPLDLMLDGIRFPGGTLSDAIRNSLRDRAARDAIRRVHLTSKSSYLLSSILSPLTPTCWEIQSSSIESIIVWLKDLCFPVNISDFFTRYRFPKLQHLELISCTAPLCDLITSRTPVLTTLALGFSHFPSLPKSQLLSILASQPNLQKVRLSGCQYLDDDNEESFRVPLHHLKEFEIAGYPRGVVGLLSRLDLPRNMDNLTIHLDWWEVPDVSQIIGPYLRDYIQWRGGSQPGPGLGLVFAPPEGDIYTILHVGDVGGIDFSTATFAEMKTFLVITIDFDRPPFQRETLDLIKYAPREEVVYFRVCEDSVDIDMEDISIQFPNLKGLHLERSSLPAAFPKLELDTDEEIFPSLQYLLLDWVNVDNGDWSPLIAFLDRRISSGNQLSSLVIVGTYHMDPQANRRIRGLPRKYTRGIVREPVV